MTNLLTITEIARRIGANPATIRRWAVSGRIRGARKVGWGWLIPADATLPDINRGGRRSGAGRKPTNPPGSATWIPPNLPEGL